MPKYNQFGTLKNDEKLSWEELVKEFGNNRTRKKLLMKSLPAFQLLKKAGVLHVMICGSFASNKSKPSDIDGVILTDSNFDENLLPDDILCVLAVYGLDFYFDTTPTSFNGKPHIEFFREGRNCERPGLITLAMETVPEESEVGL